MGNIRVRPATHDDIGAVVALSDELRRPAVARGTHYGRPPLPDTGADRAERYARFIDDARGRLVVAADEGTGQITGMALLGRDVADLLGSDAVYMTQVVVAPEFRRRGVGRRLVGAAVAYADEVGSDQIVVGVAVGGRETHRFFARLGFAPLVTRRVASVPALRRSLGLTDLRLVAPALREAGRRSSGRRRVAASAGRPLAVRRLSGRRATG